MRNIAVVTVGRSDYGILRPVLRRLRDESGLRPELIVAGAHLETGVGNTLAGIAKDGFPVRDRVPMTPTDDGPEGIADAIGRGVAGFARAYAKVRPDIVLLTGDRYEMAAAALAALPFVIPVAHIHGGELTLGAFDDALRHAITKMSHLHFAATPDAARRIAQMGEEPWRITVSGAPSLDALNGFRPLDRAALSAVVGLPLDRPTLLVTYHPVTLDPDPAGRRVDELLAALTELGMPVVFTMPNADTHGRRIRERILARVVSRPDSRVVECLGTETYFSLMGVASAMVGNSSSGIIEAASFGLPVVDVGSRQEARMRPANVIHCGDGSEEIVSALRRVLAPAFREGLRGLVNPYGDGKASMRITARLREVPLDSRLLKKAFRDLPVPNAGPGTEGGE